MRSLVRFVSIVVLVVGLWPVSPVRADPARPGNTVSQVQSLTPAVAGVVVDIVGGDAFLRVRASPGVEVLIPGYAGEPYLWIRRDGSVWRNAESPDTVLNEDRYITGDTPDATTQLGVTMPEPSWESYGTGGEVLWHDHRVHWMGSGDPPTIDPDGLVQRWEVPIEVDGVDVVVSGSLLRRSPATAAWWAVAVVTAVAVGVMGRRSSRAVVLSVTAVGGMSALTGWWAWWALPGPARSVPVVGLLAVVAVMAGGLALWRRAPVPHGPLVAGAGTALLIAAWWARAGVTAAVIPAVDPAWPWRLAVTASFGVGAVAAGWGMWRSLRPAGR